MPASARAAGGERRRVLLALAGYVVAVCVLAAILAYPLWWLLDALLEQAPPFHRLTLRLLKGLALLGLWPLLAVLGCNARAGWGLARGPGAARELGAGLIAGLASLGLLAAVLLALGVRVPAPVGGVSLPALLAGAALSAAAVALIEEIWFRGALLTVLARGLGRWGAVWATALLWALTHFVRADQPVPLEALGWTSGWQVLGGALDRLGRPGVAGALAGLAAAGVLLGQARLASGRVAACIGLHAGWVLVIRPLRKLTDFEPAAPAAFLASGYDGVTGWLAAALFGALALLWYRRERA